MRKTRKRLLHVVAAVIRDSQGRVLIQKRPAGKHAAGLWEFPGGKVHDGETRFVALQRELQEELGMQARTGQPLIRLQHTYPEYRVDLDVWELDAWEGEPVGLEGQEVRWVAPCELPGYEYPAANLPVIAAARLPDQYMVTPACGSAEELLGVVASSLQQGVRLVQFRAHELPVPEYIRQALLLLELCRQSGASLLLNRDPGILRRVPADGVLLSEVHLMALPSRPVTAGQWFAASVHDEKSLRHAAALGVDFVTLGPVQDTASHPGSPTLGWQGFEQLRQLAAMPVYAQGGLRPTDLEVARQGGARGIAGISAFRGGGAAS